MKDDDTKRNTIVVHTARTAPSYYKWAIYAALLGGLYLDSVVHQPWYLYVATAVGIATTYVLHTTYNTLVKLFNEVRINDAVMAHKQSQEKPPSKTQIPTHDPVKLGSKVLGTSDTKVEPGEPSSKDVTLFRYAEALANIQDCKEIGDARDIAWRAVEHDQIATRKAEEHDKG